MTSSSSSSSSSLGPSARQGWIPALWLGWLLFVVYGSLVPLNFQPIPLQAAFERFAHIRLLDVGVQGRGDWISNGVLYVPVGLLTMLLLMWRVGMHRTLSAVLAMALATALAVAVEFTQVFFPQRTVSLNDLIAETLGSLVGVWVAWWSHRWWPVLERALDPSRPRWDTAWLPALLAAVLLLGLFPFDILVSSGEISAKAASDLWGWWSSGALQQAGLLAWSARWLAEWVITVPLGLLWARSQHFNARSGLRTVLAQGLLAGAALGMFVEIGQFFVASGVSQGASVLSRALGWAAGSWLWVVLARQGGLEWRAAVGRHALGLGLLHALLVMLLSGWWSSAWRSAPQALARLTGGEIRFLPFYYHYYTSEAVALQSLLSTALLYAPIGLLAWSMNLAPRMAALWAGALAVVVEAGKLFPEGARPDPTNVMIAAVSAAVVLALLVWAAGVGQAGSRLRVSDTRDSAAGQGLGAATAVVGFAAAVAAVWVVNFPLWNAAVGVFLMAAMALVWLRPVALLGVVVAALPLLNLSLWSGREYVDEFDILVLLCLAAATCSRSCVGRLPCRDRSLSVLMAAVLASTFLAALLAWAPWNAAALMEVDGPLSPWMSLRLFKGVLWAGALYWVVRRQHAAGLPVQQSMAAGMVLGLVGVVAVVVWERITFVGLLDTATPYRVAGPVLPMRLGGAYLDAFLVTGYAFAWTGLLSARSAAWRMLCALAVLGGTYAIAVTFTRTTYVAAIVVVAVSVFFWVRAAELRNGLQRWLLFLCIPVAAVVWVFFAGGSFAMARFMAVGEDLQTRVAHVVQVVDVARASGHNFLWGRGLGRYPVDNYWFRAGDSIDRSAMAVHQFQRRHGLSVLQIGPGNGLYVDQAIAWKPSSRIKVTLRSITTGPGGLLQLSLCEKWLLASSHCVVKTLDGPETPGKWIARDVDLESSSLGRQGRPIRFSLANVGPVRIDVDEVSLRDERGVELLRNTSFESGGDHWNFTSDDHLGWHAKNMLLSVWYDMGLLGMSVFCGLLALAIWRSGRALWAGQGQAQSAFVALLGLMVVAVFDAVVDEPRYLLLLLLLAWLAAILGRRQDDASADHNSIS